MVLDFSFLSLQFCRWMSPSCQCVGLLTVPSIMMTVVTALHGLQTRSSDENSVCLSVRQMREL